MRRLTALLLQKLSEHGQRIKPPKHMPICHHAGHPKEPKRNGFVSVGLQPCFDLSVVRLLHGLGALCGGLGQPLGERTQALGAGGIRATALPDVCKELLGNPAVARCAAFGHGAARRDRQPQKRERVEGVCCRQPKRHAVRLCEPEHLPKRPDFFSRDFRRAELAVVLQQARKQNRAVPHRHAHALKRWRQRMKRQVRIGGNGIKPKVNGAHADL